MRWSPEPVDRLVRGQAHDKSSARSPMWQAPICSRQAPDETDSLRKDHGFRFGT